jgi:hypothetical protein
VEASRPFGKQGRTREFTCKRSLNGEINSECPFKTGKRKVTKEKHKTKGSRLTLFSMVDPKTHLKVPGELLHIRKDVDLNCVMTPFITFLPNIKHTKSC